MGTEQVDDWLGEVYNSTVPVRGMLLSRDHSLFICCISAFLIAPEVVLEHPAPAPAL